MITKPKGTYDLFGKKSNDVICLQNIITNLMFTYNYNFIRTPLFEASELFHRGVGETTDIVTKETYDFKDRGDRNITLRPEGTASAVRCFIENKMYGDVLPKKFWYYGPMYRYERPQSGRYREHYQFGCEVFGSNEPIMDAEIISIPYNLFVMFGLKNVTVNINSLGDNESRNNYREALINYFKPHLDSLCDDCKERFLKNPLRILDCKVDKNNEILKNAPRTIDYLNKESKEFFDKVLSYLDTLHINYVVNPNTVRGLDYYTHTVFEIEADIKDFGNSKVLCGGGRYNNLIENLGGPSIPAVGFGMGTERLLNALEKEEINISDPDSLDCYIVPVSENEKTKALALCNTLRLYGFKADIDNMDRNVKNNFKQALRFNSIFTIVVGEEELKRNSVKVKNMLLKEEEEVSLVNLFEYLADKLNNMGSSCSCGDDCCHDEHCNCEGEN